MGPGLRACRHENAASDQVRCDIMPEFPEKDALEHDGYHPVPPLISGGT